MGLDEALECVCVVMESCNALCVQSLEELSVQIMFTETRTATGQRG